MYSNNKKKEYDPFEVDTSWGGIGGQNTYGSSPKDPYTDFSNTGYGDDYKSPWETFEAPESNAPKVDTSWEGIDSYNPGSSYGQEYDFTTGYTTPEEELAEMPSYGDAEKPQGSFYGLGYDSENGYNDPFEEFKDTETPEGSYGVEYNDKEGYFGGEYTPEPIKAPEASYGVQYDDDEGYSGGEYTPEEIEKPGSNYGVEYDDEKGYTKPKPALSGAGDDQQTNETLPKYKTDDEMYAAYVDQYKDLGAWYNDASKEGLHKGDGEYQKIGGGNTDGWEAGWVKEMNEKFGTNHTDLGQFSKAQYGQHHWEKHASQKDEARSEFRDLLSQTPEERKKARERANAFSDTSIKR